MRQKNLKRVSKRLLSFVLSLAMIFTLMLSTSIPVYAMGITVKVVNDNTEYTLDVEPSDTIEKIKNQLVEKTEISTEQQILKYNNIELENNRTLADYDIQKGAVLELELKTLIQVPGSGTEEDPYIISNTQEFKDVLGKSKDGTYYKLSDNFDNTEEITTPISNFHGSLDGNGKTINVNIDNSKGTNYSVGLFSVNDGQISNLNVAGKIVGGRSTATGGICAYNYSGVISNCNNYAEVIGTDTVGGICGCDWYDDGKFLQCNNYGNISGNEQVGGICGSSKGSVKECENRGSVTAAKYYAGGIVGKNCSSMEDERVEKCKNYGNVTCESYREYIGYDNSQMAYKKGNDGSYSVIGKVGNAWQQIHYKDWPIGTETNNKNLSVSLTPEIVSDGKLLKFTVSITNSTSDTIYEAKAVVRGDTELSGCDRSSNRTNTDNSIMTMSYNDVTFLAFSKDTGFRIVNTDYDHYDMVDAPQINEICDSAYSAQWNIDSIAGNETVTRTFYMRCLEGEDFSDADLNKIVNSAFHTHDWKYSVNGNKIESYCTAEGCTSGTSEMNKCSLILSAYDSVYSGKAYDGASVTNNITSVTGATAGSIKYVGRDGTTYTESTTAPTNAGKYTALVTIGGVTASADFEITKGQAEKPSADTTKFVYNGSDQTYQIADSELYTVSGNVQKDAGTYTVTVSLKDKNKTEWSDGTTDDLTFTFTIAKADTKLIAEPTARKLTYAGHPQNLINAASATGGTVYYRLDGTEEWSETVPTAANAGTYKVFYYVKANDAKNYNDTGSEENPSGSVEISVAKRTLTADMVTVSDDEKYTGEAMVPTVTVSDKVNDVDIIGSADYTVSGNEAQTKVGAYDITVSASENGNYTGSVTKTWNIVTSHFAEDSIQAKGYEGVYDGKAHTISVTAPKGATITYSETENGEYTDKAPSYKNMTEATVYYHVEKYGYETAKGSAVVKITPKTIGLTWGDHEFTYNGKVQAPKASATDLIDGDSCDIIVSEGSVNYTEKPLCVTATGISNPNYQLPTAGLEQEYTIAKKTVGIKWGNTELTYTGEEQAPTATATGLVDGDTCEIEVSGAATGAGTHTVKAEKVSNNNYKLPKDVETTYVISKADAVYGTPEAKEDLVYNGADQSLITAGTTEDGTFMYKVGDGEWGTEIPAGLNAGDYAVSYKVVGDGNHNDSAEGTVTITVAKAKVTVTANDAEKHVNKADPELYDTINGMIGMEQLKGVSIKREAGEAVGTYAINVTVDADANPNYDITTVSGIFTINDHDWSGEWKTVKEATETENGKREKSCAYDGCEQKLYETIPATGNPEEPEKPGEGTLRKDAEVAPDAPISEATLDNPKSELIKADGIFTEAEKEAISNGSNARVWLEITGVDMSTISKDDQAAMEAAAKEIMGENLNLTYFNADLFKQVDGTAKSQIHDPGTMIKVTIQIPEELLNHDKNIAREYKILRLHDGKVDVISGTFNADTNEFTFETDKFSTYAIAYGDTQLVTGVSLDTTEKTLTKAGETLQLTATVTPENAANKNLHWTSSDPKVATVDENGLVTAVSNGTAVITVTTEDGSYTATCKITVNIPAKPADTKPADKNTTNKPDAKKDTTSAKVPKTDDPMNAAPWAVVALIAGCVAVITGKKRKQERR